MAWDDRIKAAAYVAPSGGRIGFAYEDVSRNFDKQTSGFNFPTGFGTYVQDNGTTGRKYPLIAYFSGPDCDEQASAFEDALAESGIGKLEHPIYGTVDVVPYGTVTRRDPLKTAANQSVVEVTFWETLPLVYPAAQNDPASDVLAAAFGAGDGLAGMTVSNFQKFKTSMTKLVGTISAVIGGVKELKTTVDSYVRNITGFLDAGAAFVADAITSVVDLISLPSTISTSFKSKLDLYKTIISSAFGSDSKDYKASRVVSVAAVIGSVATAVETEFATQTEAIAAANDVLELAAAVEQWSQQQAETDSDSDYEVYKPLIEAVSLCAGYLVEESFSLKKERKITIDRPRTIIDLCAELYGEIDEKLDFMIASNNLSGSEILELPPGRGILYYV